jgi:RimJ/RimL family protein N-acetyltransferase
MAAVEPTAASLEAAWPLFGLRIRSEHLVLRLPTDGDLLRLLEVARAGIHPPEQMPFGVAWTDATGADFEQGFLAHHWAARGSWSTTDWRLNLMVEYEGRPIGSQSVWGQGFLVHRTVDTGSWLGRTYQGHGLGKEMRTAVLALAFDGLEAHYAESSAFLDNARSNAVSRSLGYEENGRGSLAPRGVARETQRFRMSVEGWRARPRPPVEIGGLDACRDMFGI